MNSKFKFRIIWVLFFVLIGYSSYSQIDPQKKYKELFQEIQKNKIFSDQKIFVDCEPKENPDLILKAYRTEKGSPEFNLKDFVALYFDTIQNDTTAMLQHIHYLWTDLTKNPENQNKFSSLLALPNSYIVPGGRFREIYYWDSYFTMLGLQEDNQITIIENMVDNFSYLIDTYGFIPNGNRTYYLSRSQPPFYAEMVEVLAESKGDSIYKKYLKFLEKEYEFWMDGAENLNETNPTFRRVVRLPDGEI